MLEGAGSWYLVPIWEPEQTPKPPRHFSAHLAPSHAVFLYSSRPSEALTTVGGPLVLIGQTRDWLKTGIWPSHSALELVALFGYQDWVQNPRDWLGLHRLLEERRCRWLSWR
jgi:hypothetical protein